MKAVLGRLLLSLWFVGILVLAIHETPAQGQSPLATQYLPLLQRAPNLPGQPPLEEYIAMFMSSVQGSHELYTMRGDGSHLIRLTNDARHKRTPAWSPDGARIAYIDGHYASTLSLMVIDSDGTDLRPLLTGEFDDIRYQWSPIGSALLADLWGLGDSTHTVMLIRLDDTEPQLLAAVDYTLGGREGWSPSGRYLHFPQHNAVTQTAELWVMEVPTGERREISTTYYSARQPLWAPDDSEILFIQSESGVATWVAAVPDGSSTRPLLDASYTILGWILNDRYLLLKAPDGNLARMPVAGGAIVPLTSHNDTVLGVHVSPGGRHLLYSTLSGSSDVYWLDLAAGAPPVELAVSCYTCQVNTASWSADGSSVLFSVINGERGSRSAIYHARITPTSGTLNRLIDTRDHFWGVEYLPSSSHLGMARLLRVGYPLSYPPPYLTLPETLDTESGTVTDFQVGHGLFEFGGWRHLP